MTRWAVVSDIHGNLPALEAVVAAVAAAGPVDRWLNLGDLVSGPLWPRETAAWLMRQGWPTIAGNHERQLLTFARDRMGPSDAFAAAALTDAQRAWMASLPTAMAPAPGLACVHGTPGSDLQYLLETVTPQGLRAATEAEIGERLGAMESTPGPAVPAAPRGGMRSPATPALLKSPLLLCGHTHVPRCVAWRGGWIANPGSVGLPAYDDDHPFPHVVENGTPEARYALVDDTGSDGAKRWQVTLCAVAYDCEGAARRAEANGRGDWADALRTGRVGRTEAQATRASRAPPRA